MKIITSEQLAGCWVAHTDEYDGAPDSRSPIGSGNTEREAINELVEQLVESEYDRGRAHELRCKTCHGSGTVYDTGSGPDAESETCPTCYGEGDGHILPANAPLTERDPCGSTFDHNRDREDCQRAHECMRTRPVSANSAGTNAPLTEQLTKAARELCDEYYRGRFDAHDRARLIDNLDAALANAPRVVTSSGWIPVGERLPPETLGETFVLMFAGGEVYIASYSKGEFRFCYSVYYPTHWMPVPAPPCAEVKLPGYRCVVCNTAPVDAESGFDTCDNCARAI